MILEKFYFHEGCENVRLDVFLCDNSREYSRPTRPFMLICPGGGYGYLSAREAEPIARRYMGYGYNAAVLYYTVRPETETTIDEKSGLPLPIIEAARAISLIRENADVWHTDPEKIAVVGFSAGGHLAGSSGVYWDDERVQARIGKTNNKPNAVVLAYPVVTAVGPTHLRSFQNLLSNENLSDEDKRNWSLEQNVKPTCPPMFLFHTVTDRTVPVTNSIVLAEALAKNHVSFELHVLPTGNHGISLAEGEVLPEDDVYNARWVDWSVQWLKKTFRDKE